MRGFCARPEKSVATGLRRSHAIYALGVFDSRGGGNDECAEATRVRVVLRKVLEPELVDHGAEERAGKGPQRVELPLRLLPPSVGEALEGGGDLGPHEERGLCGRKGGEEVEGGQRASVAGLGQEEQVLDEADSVREGQL